MNVIKSTVAVFLALCLAASLVIFPSANNVTSSPTPFSAESAGLKWSLRLGTSYRNAPSIPVYSGGFLYVMSGRTIYKLNAESGETAASSQMSASPGYANVSVAVGAGMVFCPTGDGELEAFSLDTLEKKWSYQDELGGQPLTDAVYSGGFVYTGFWNDEDMEGAFVCLDGESGELKWRLVKTGGFYHSPCAVVDGYTILGGDDGAIYDDGENRLVCIDNSTGEITATIPIVGDQRSAVVYDEASQRIYFTTKANMLYSVAVTEGRFYDSKSLELRGQSTAAPCVVDGRIYVGVEGGYITVAHAESMSEIYSVEVPAYPQGGVLASAQGDRVYVYAVCNAPPGGIVMLIDSPGQTEGRAETIFTPADDAGNYSISTLCADESGVIYYKNDSGYIFAVENKTAGSFFTLLRSFFEKLRAFITLLNGIL